MATEYRYTYAAWAEAFTIFAKYDPGFAEVATEHDLMYAGGDKSKMSAEDQERLEELGWDWSEEYDCWEKNT